MTYIDKRQQIEHLQQKINEHGTLTPEVKNKINYKFRLDWNYYSNSMEGNTLSIEETRSVMIGNINVKDKPLKDIMEMQGHDEVITEILKIGEGNVRLSEARIKAIHKGIMYEDNISNRDKIGVWKTDNNYIINYKGERFDFTPMADVADSIHELLNTTNAAIDKIAAHKKDAPHPADIALQFHLDYVKIHPFYDGNGRTARILTNLLLISFGLPPFWIRKSEEDRYSRYIADIQGYGGSPDLFYDFIADLILRSQQLVLDAIEGKDISEEDDFLKEIRLIQNRTEHPDLTKSPKLVFAAFEAVQKEVWYKLQQTLKHFDTLFSDAKTKRLVNHLDEIFPERNLLKNPLIVSDAPRKTLIFGHDVYEEDIRLVTWNHTLYGLKGGNNANNIKTTLRITFNPKHYKTELTVDQKILLEEDRQYGDVMLGDFAKAMDKRLKDYLLLEIKGRIG